MVSATYTNRQNVGIHVIVCSSKIASNITVLYTNFHMPYRNLNCGETTSTRDPLLHIKAELGS